MDILSMHLKENLRNMNIIQKWLWMTTLIYEYLEDYKSFFLWPLVFLVIISCITNTYLEQYFKSNLYTFPLYQIQFSFVVWGCVSS